MKQHGAYISTRWLRTSSTYPPNIVAANVAKKRGFLVLNQHWLVGELRLRGHDVTSAGFSNAGFDLNIEQPEIEIHELLEFVAHPVDTILFHDDSGLPRVLGLESCSLTKVFYSVDAHHHHQWHSSFAALFDLVLVAQKNYLGHFLFSANKHWFPVWSLVEEIPSPQKKYGAVFRGTMDPKLHPKRKSFFDELQLLVPVDAASGNYADCYRASKIVVNQSVSDDLNFRVFEAMACGALLITPSGTVGLEELFQDGRELIIYERDNAEDAAAKIRYYLEHEDERARIARSGWERVKEAHSNKSRTDELLSLLDGTRVLDEPQPRIAHDFASKVYIFSFVAHRTAGAVPSIRFLTFAAKSFVSAITESSVLSDDDLSGLFLVLTDLLREQGQNERCLELLKIAHEARGEYLMFSLLYLEQLLILQHKEEADLIAKKISDKPEELLTAVPRLLAEVRMDRATWLKKPPQSQT